ncbi:MAG: 50S ribosomal protein L3 [Actinomycetota bacterium]
MKNVKAILGTKIGMTQIYAEDGRAIPVTVIDAGPCTVTQIRSVKRDGYTAVQLGFNEVPDFRLNRPQKGHLRKSKSTARKLTEIRTADASNYSVGQKIKADIFSAGDIVDVTGTSKGHGFSGAMKRWNFHGKPASHGTERKHRAPGSQNAGTTPGRVFPGKKLPGRYGHERVTVMSLEIVEANAEQNLLLVKGAIPGPKGSIVMVKTAAKLKAPKTGVSS